MLLLALAATTMSGCAPEPQPSPTPTPAFASEEEAFAAAEEVYRAYNEAGNARIAGESTPDPQDYLIGEALAGDIDGGRFLDEQGLRLAGAGAVASFLGTDVTATDGTTAISGVVCLDVAGIRLIDSAGADVTPPERTDIVAQLVTFIEVDGGLRISSESATDAAQC